MGMFSIGVASEVCQTIPALFAILSALKIQRRFPSLPSVFFIPVTSRTGTDLGGVEHVSWKAWNNAEAG